MAKLNKKKYKQALLYLASKIPFADHGRVKFYKLLYFADFNHYHEFGKSITNESYRKLALGPAPCHYQQIIDELQSEGAAEIGSLPVAPQYQDRETLRPKVPYDESMFTLEELATLKEVAEYYGRMTGNDLTAISHQDPPWLLAEEAELLDYDDTWYRHDPALDEGPDPIADALAESGIVEELEKKFGRKQ